MAQGYQAFSYDTPIVTIQEGSGWIINGYFKLIHIINMEKYSEMVDQLTLVANQDDNQQVLSHMIQQMNDHLAELRGTQTRRTRSIDWIGSAWKWLAGNPDASDWNKILDSQDDVIRNSNHQYQINSQVFELTRNITKKINELVLRSNNVSAKYDMEKLHQEALNKALVLKEAISEIIRACQLAKKGIVNSNLLDKNELNDVIAETKNLPYGNIIEAVEYGEPSIYTNGSLILYVLAIPKVSGKEYTLLRTRGAITRGLQVDLAYEKILSTHDETYGITKECLKTNNTTICEMGALTKLPEDGCIPRILKGGDAPCHFIANMAEVIELIAPDTVFITNYIGNVTSNGVTQVLKGTYLIQLTNETVHLGGKNFTSYTKSGLQALPPVLTNITDKGLRVNLDFVHQVGLNNIKQLKNLNTKNIAFTVMEMSTIGILAWAIWCIWLKLTKRTDIPKVQIPASCATSDLRDADI